MEKETTLSRPPKPDFDTPAGKVAAARAWDMKISNRQKFNRHCLTAIKEFLEDQEIYLPDFKSDYKRDRRQILQYDTHGEDLERAFGRLISMYYTIKESGWSLGAAFMGRNGDVETRTLAHACSRNKLDQVWILRKEQLIRRTYKNWLAVGMAEGWLFKYTPVHIVLTVPHGGGEYKGKRFFGDELLNDFNLIRKNPLWLAMVHGGEYGLETKRSRSWQNGLHIHLHSFTMLNKYYDRSHFKKLSKTHLVDLLTWVSRRSKIFESETEAREFFEEKTKGELYAYAMQEFEFRKVTEADFQNVLWNLWNRQTGATKVWVEKLYRYKKDPETNKWITEYVENKQDKDLLAEPDGPGTEIFKPQLLQVRKKFYIDDKSPLEDWTAGILECIKYHFKGDTFYNSDTKEWDVLLMMEVLNNTENKRFYGRFGAFYKEKQLSFNFGKEDEAAAVLPEFNKGELEAVAAQYPTRADLIAKILELNQGANVNLLNRTNKARLTEILAAKLRGPGEGITEFDNSENMAVEDTAPKVANAVEGLINPFTLEVPTEEEYDFCVFHPAERAHQSRYALENNCMSRETDLTKFTFFSKKTSIKSLIRAMMTNRLKDIKQKDPLALEAENLNKYLIELNGLFESLGYEQDYLFSWRAENINWSVYDQLGPVAKLRYLAEKREEYLKMRGVVAKQAPDGSMLLLKESSTAELPF